jgi:Flp pilus assembly CpaE family ATPase
MWTFLSVLRKNIVNESFSSWLATKSRAAIISVCCVRVAAIGFRQTPRRRKFSISLFDGPQHRKRQSPGTRGRSWYHLIQLRRGKATADRRICLVDLDFQTSHICDYLDIEPRLHIEEISANPKRLDSQLFEVFVTHHSSGVDVFASPRSKFDTCALDFAALDELFGLISTRYDLILIDFPVNWYSWTPKIIAASSGIIVSGVNSIPGLRQIAEALTTLRATNGLFGEIRVAINKCERGLFGKVARRQHVESVLPGEQIVYVRNDPTALESINTGMPMALSNSRRSMSKDIGKITAFCAGLTSPSAVVA